MQKELRSARFLFRRNFRDTFVFIYLLGNYNGIFTGNQESLYNLYTKNTIMDLKKRRVKTGRGREGYV